MLNLHSSPDLITSHLISSHLGGKPSKYGSVLFRGVGQDLDDESNPLLYPLLTASSKAYSAKPGEGRGKQREEEILIKHSSLFLLLSNSLFPLCCSF
jgi:hypothetical protein